jgi:hypothetical protein
MTSGSAAILVALCFQSTNQGSSPVVLGGDLYVDVSTTRIPYAVSGSATPGAGTYDVGFCVENFSQSAIDNNDWSVGWVQVTQ